MNQLIDRVKNILLNPKEEFAALKDEPTDIASIFKNYLLIIAALPAVGTLLSFGAYWGFGTRFRIAIVTYVLTLASFYIGALVVDNLAPHFASTRSMLNAFKLVAYSATASMVGGLLAFVPGLGWLLQFAGGIYSIYLFYVGIPIFMETQEGRELPYAIVSILAIVVIFVVLGWILMPLFGVSMMMGR